MADVLTLADMPDLSDWRLAPLWTLEQAALLWAGINPAFFTFRDIWQEHPRKQARAKIALQAFSGGIVLKTLTVQDLYLHDGDSGIYCTSQKTAVFSMNDIAPNDTTIMQDVLISWATKERVLSLRQTIQAEEQVRREAAKAEAEKQEMKALPYCVVPEFETPEFETACIAIKEFWNKQTVGVTPPKALIVQDFIKDTFKKITGVEPTRAAIQRIDSLTRPPLFKNQ
ncbi:hypothetical protein O3682_02985 [Neisseria sp. 27098_8_112]|uniref:hypothetical protein n=1 Tax=Neisseria sp. 27098_8_112 TaxID=3003682 RepID=UPI00352DC923